MAEDFFKHPILNSPYEYPGRHWELDSTGQPTQHVIAARRIADFITPIPKAKKKKGEARQAEMTLDEGKGLSSEEQQYTASMISRRNLLGPRGQPPRTLRSLGLRRVRRRLGDRGRLRGQGRRKIRSYADR